MTMLSSETIEFVKVQNFLETKINDGTLTMKNYLLFIENLKTRQYYPRLQRWIERKIKQRGE